MAFENNGNTFLEQEAESVHELPELPNFISILYHKTHHFFWEFLYQWESIVFSILIAVLIVLLFYFGTRKKQLIPTGLQNFLEMIVEGFRHIILGIIGPKGEVYVPFLGILFIYLLSMNLFGLVPLMKSPTSNLNVTAAHAIVVFVLVQYLNIRNMGFFGFLYHLAGSPKGLGGWLMAPLMFPIELITQLSRPLTLAFRLFGNIFGEDILISYLALAGVLLFPFLSPIGFPLQTPFLFLGLLTGMMQALVFTLLTTVYILLSIPDENGNH